MQLHELKKTYKEKGKKRIGRGGKRGTTSGRGQKGQKSRAGRRIKPGIRDLLIRLPKRRGLKNPSRAQKPKVINVGDLEKRIESGTMITSRVLQSAGLVRADARVKILGDGMLTKTFVIAKGIAVSNSARKKIEATGGTIQ